jgi:hypothetical protein
MVAALSAAAFAQAMIVERSAAEPPGRTLPFLAPDLRSGLPSPLQSAGGGRSISASSRCTPRQAFSSPSTSTTAWRTIDVELTSIAYPKRMLPVEWPIAAGAADRPVEPARTAGRGRLPVVRRDLFLDDRARLTEQERALMSAMLGTLVDQLADEIRLGLPTELLAQVEADRQDVASRLWQSGALDRPALILLLLRRASAQLIAAACRGRAA